MASYWSLCAKRYSLPASCCSELLCEDRGPKRGVLVEGSFVPAPVSPRRRMSSGSGVPARDFAELRAEVLDLRAEVIRLKLRVSELEEQGFDLVDDPTVGPSSVLNEACANNWGLSLLCRTLRQLPLSRWIGNSSAARWVNFCAAPWTGASAGSPAVIPLIWLRGIGWWFGNTVEGCTRLP